MAAKARGNRKKGPRMITEILRLETGLGAKTIAKALGVPKNTVKSYLRQHEAACADAAPGPIAVALAPPAAAVPYVAPWAAAVDWARRSPSQCRAARYASDMLR